MTAAATGEPVEIDEELKRREDDLAETDEYDESPPSDIVAFNELRSCSDLKRLHDAGQLQIQPDFQREVVWEASQQTRFIDSLAKQLPIPSMCISLDYKTDSRQVVDGLQRMSAIIKFLSDRKWRLSGLKDVDHRIANKTVEYIEQHNPEIINRVENTVIPVTVLRCDLSKRSHQEYLFTIFHRLNTGGLKLNNQEIRNCIYSGQFNDMLKSVVWSETSMSLFGLSPGRKYRFSNEELFLRILAFNDGYESYKGPLSKFLNEYMSKFRSSSDDLIADKRAILESALSLIYEKMLAGEPFPRLSRATIEAIFIGVIRNISVLSSMDQKDLYERYIELRSNDAFSIEALKEGLAAPDRVKERLNTAIAIFGR
ncbi:DUF262 domain-containing protein [Sphingosinicella rhizophila]|uniref:DUF262 domain-containing protein n=1 Tax=Sphingosinicella rhizophila TaxID=3050082 RepID=A0ABU3Q886_9SPHN|nr:DUF262 domain-containing protein [Sphingosinicella sp. GR2756]MDT9599630.1 DUF262 domain-containing protein [Sphingosinicella sp. GR2756]